MRNVSQELDADSFPKAVRDPRRVGECLECLHPVVLVGLACTLCFQSSFSTLPSGPIPTKPLASDWIGARRSSAEHLASCSTPGSSVLGVLPLCVGMERLGERRPAHHHHHLLLMKSLPGSSVNILVLSLGSTTGLHSVCSRS